MATLKSYWAKLVVSVIFWQCFGNFLVAQQGSLLLLERTALYTNKNLTQARIYTNRRQAHAVLEWDFSNQPKFKIVYTPILKKRQGTGYIMESKPVLQELGIEPVRVYQSLPTRNLERLDYLWIPANALKLSTESTTSKDYAYVKWQMVSYNLQGGQAFWVAPKSWVFRPQKNAAWLNNLLKNLQKENLSKDMELTMLLGLVEIGYTARQVELALGQPEQKTLDAQNEQWQWVYAGQRILLEKGVVVQVLLY